MGTSPRSASRRAATAAVLAAVLLATLVATLPAEAATDTVTVTFRGATVTVPSDWPVLRLDGGTGCVRFDRHAVYLGDPASSDCPADVVGHIEAVHITGGVVSDARSPLAAVGPGRTVTGGTAIHPDFVVSNSHSAVRVVVTAGPQPQLAGQIVDSVSLAATSARAPKPAAAQAAPGTLSRTTAAARATSTYTGLGFDTCVTPSVSAIAAWSASPYRAVNTYIGGASRGCPTQPNLDAGWVTSVAGRGWTIIPTYVGLQAPCSPYTHRISRTRAAAQGKASADDAVAILGGLGLGAGTIVYFDIEAYDTSKNKCLAAVRTFLDAWTTQLHARGYLSGVYTSSTPMKPTLVDKVGDPTFAQPDDIWFARWNNDPSIFGDPAIPDRFWNSHQRIHQYRGGHPETWGGVTINIDNNSVDADTAPGAPLPSGTFVRRRGTAAVYRIAGNAPIYVSSWAPFGGKQPVQKVSGTRFRLLRTHPRTGTFVKAAGAAPVFRIYRGVPSHVTSWDTYGGPKPTTSVDPAALDRAGTGGVWDHLISASPSVRMTGPTTRMTTRSSTAASWASPILSSAVRTYDVRYRTARWTSAFSDWTYTKRWQGTTATHRVVRMKRGYDYCFAVRARNWAGQRTGWSSRRCFTRPLDDRSLSASAGWKRRTSPDYIGGTLTSTTSKGAWLRLSAAQVQRVGVVATTCARCGTVAVVVDGRRVGIVSLRSSTTRLRQLIMLPPFSARSGNVVLRVRSSGLPVRIDGLAVSKS